MRFWRFACKPTTILTKCALSGQKLSKRRCFLARQQQHKITDAVQESVVSLKQREGESESGPKREWPQQRWESMRDIAIVKRQQAFCFVLLSTPAQLATRLRLKHCQQQMFCHSHRTLRAALKLPPCNVATLCNVCVLCIFIVSFSWESHKKWCNIYGLRARQLLRLPQAERYCI